MQSVISRMRLWHAVWRRGLLGLRSESNAAGPASSGDSSKDAQQGKEVSLAVSSLRADTVAAAGLDISRK